MSNDSDQNIVPTGKQELSRYSSDLIKRGLDLANKSQVANGKSLQPPQTPTVQAEAEDLLKCGYEKFCKDDYQSAISYYTQALQISPDYAEAYYMRGIARECIEDNLQGAIDDYTQALRIDPNDTSSYYQRGAAREDLEDYQGAIDDYTQILRIDPNDTSSYHRRGEVSAKLGDYKSAIDDYTQALRIAPDFC